MKITDVTLSILRTATSLLRKSLASATTSTEKKRKTLPCNVSDIRKPKSQHSYIRRRCTSNTRHSSAISLGRDSERPVRCSIRRSR